MPEKKGQGTWAKREELKGYVVRVYQIITKGKLMQGLVVIRGFKFEINV